VEEVPGAGEGGAQGGRRKESRGMGGGEYTAGEKLTATPGREEGKRWTRGRAERGEQRGGKERRPAE